MFAGERHNWIGYVAKGGERDHCQAAAHPCSEHGDGSPGHGRGRFAHGQNENAAEREAALVASLQRSGYLFFGIHGQNCGGQDLSGITPEFGLGAVAEKRTRLPPAQKTRTRSPSIPARST